MFKKDLMIHGVVLAIIVLAAGYGALTGLNIWISDYFFHKAPIFSESTIRVIAIFINVFPFRYFMLRTNRERTGRGILLVTFVVGLTYFFYYLQ